MMLRCPLLPPPRRRRFALARRSRGQLGATALLNAVLPVGDGHRGDAGSGGGGIIKQERTTRRRAAGGEQQQPKKAG
jgi:hypothetical protein